MVGSSFNISSKFLNRVVRSHIFRTSGKTNIRPIVLIFNDGQDFSALKMSQTVEYYEVNYPEIPLVIIGIDAGDRINEYGSIYKSDYKNRGHKALIYNKFITKEFIPYLQSSFALHLEPSTTGFAGFSLGGLSAIDIVLNNSDIFGFCGVFSGSFWWRYLPFTDDDPDGCRIMHEYIDRHAISTDQRFWFQAGTNDEDCDRNGNGVIDSIDDTLDIIKSLERKGYKKDKNVTYYEVYNGTHDPYTWGRAMPVFIDWAIKPIMYGNTIKIKTA